MFKGFYSKHAFENSTEERLRVMRCKFLLFLAVLLLLFGLAPESAFSSEKRVLSFAWDRNLGPLNPHLYMPNQMVGQVMVYEPLVQSDENGNIEPWLAESWSISDDGKIYTFTLRKDVKFSDGSPFNAQIVARNFDAVMGNAKRHEWMELIRKIDSWKALDNYTFELRLKIPYVATLENLSLVRPLRFLGAEGFPDDDKTQDGIKAPVGTGPWVLKETVMGDYDLFVRNEHYWGPKPAFDEVKIKVIPEPQSRVVALETGGIDVILSAGTGAGAITISFEEFERLRGEGDKYTSYLSSPRYTQGFAVNSNRKPTNELAVRQAILHAVDTESFSKHLMMGIEPPAYSLFSETTRYCDVNLPPYKLDREYAARLLDEADWKLPENGKTREKKGEKLEIDIHFIGTHYFHKTAAAAIQGDLQKIGIQVNLMADEANIFFGMGQSGDFNLAYVETWGVPSDPLDFLSSVRAPQGVLSHARLGLDVKEKLDGDIGALMDSHERDVTQELVKNVLTTIHEQAIFLPVSMSVGIAIHKKDRIEGIRFMPLRNEIDFASMKPGKAF